LFDATTLAIVDSNDELEARNHPAGLRTNVPITNIRDYNRDAIVDSNDSLVPRNNATSVNTATKFINVLLANAAPEGDIADTGPIVSALTIAAIPTGGSAIRLAQPLDTGPLSDDPAVTHITGRDATNLLHDDSARNAMHTLPVIKLDDVAAVLDLDDTLLDGVLADLELG
jgi:hypothetical protein